MRLLLVEDDPMIGASVQRGLKQEGYSVDWARDGAAAEGALADGVHELILLDLGLPRKSGLELLAALRRRGLATPVLVITARDSVADRVKGLDLGADDYMVKPFELAELEARVRALTRRSTGTVPLLQFGALAFDQTNRCALLHDELLDLSARELGLLEILMQRAGRLVSKDQLVDHLCGWGEEVSHNAIEVYVHRLRKKLESSGATITTVRGLGYCFEKSAHELRA